MNFLSLPISKVKLKAKLSQRRGNAVFGCVLQKHSPRISHDVNANKLLKSRILTT